MQPERSSAAARTALAARARRAPDVIGKRSGIGGRFQREVQVAVRGPVAVARGAERPVGGALQLHALLYTAAPETSHGLEPAAAGAVLQRAVAAQVVAHGHPPALVGG